ncbi:MULTISPECIES: SfnB family sulfur acquisition oxidoreductase [Pseudomonas syringae group]|uniref:Acyl-CoA dehydrogenase family protein n=2 Tax=Pseudomonas syringae group genomosp. 3 TaxID=251701 RepID=Q883C8_PSESM|nr:MULTISPECIES: SfnB family sulfur acquisition oxidoreductase [Pseudomonas syringae group]AAO55949.1 acyl-CoA dehydrogenase family protein [Pseudomonas syringae pv. tomato str. DC3000]KKI26697.1 acyl-CoA dehydrogenase [Pseudomonas syringae pv. persicae]KPB88636.1 Acyl-CoA dehydrogenase family protein [Pseudomonas syringae pv. maculicola]KPB92554.1 Acyl-CoA dehydrogenase family protein [Pseudomonas syringae pv. maculicola]KPC19409.1 Acyl-CoA dehydrogenase family protein [Pseudomonas syringae p
MNTPLQRPLADSTGLIENDAHALAVATALAQEFSIDAALRDRERQIPYSELDAVSRSGILGISIPLAFGGAEVNNVILAKVIAQIAQADGSLGQILQNHFHTLEALRVYGSRAQQQRIFAEVLAGALFGVAVDEQGTTNSQICTAVLAPSGEGYRISGRKFCATCAPYTRQILASAVDAQGARYMVFISLDALGLSIVDDGSCFGQRTVGGGSVMFDNVYVTSSDVVPFQVSLNDPNCVERHAQFMHAAVGTGIARAAYEDTLRFVREHARPWPEAAVDKARDDPLTIIEIGRLIIRLHAAEALLERAGAAVDLNRKAVCAENVALASMVVAAAQTLSTEVSLAAGSKLIELGGARATLSDYGLDRHWRNARVHTLYDPARWGPHQQGQQKLAPF